MPQLEKGWLAELGWAHQRNNGGARVRAIDGVGVLQPFLPIAPLCFEHQQLSAADILYIRIPYRINAEEGGDS